MTGLRSLVMVTGVLLVAGAWAAAASTGPRYAGPETKNVIEKMIEAHGGLEPWRSCPAVSFNSHLKVNFGDDNWVDFWEEVEVEQGSRRACAVLPNADGTKGMIAFDGEKAWSAGNLQGIAKAPARFSAWRNFYLFNIPWLTQDAGVILGEPGEGKLPNDAQTYITVEMTFKEGTGDTPKDRYVLYIDPETYQLKASEYGMTFSSMLPEGVESSPRSVFVWDKRSTVDGLVVLTGYNVFWTQSGDLAVAGEVSNWSFRKPFDESRMQMPVDGNIDSSQP